MTTPSVEIEIAPFIAQLWKLNFTTLPLGGSAGPLLDVKAHQDDDDLAIYLTVSLRFLKQQLACVTSRYLHSANAAQGAAALDCHWTATKFVLGFLSHARTCAVPEELTLASPVAQKCPHTFAAVRSILSLS